jgi:hypothetical protein
MELHCGIDLHSNNNFVAIQSGSLGDVTWRRLRNDLGQVLGFLEPYRKDIVGVAVESTYNWYWLVDGLTEAGYDVRLVNTTKAADYEEMKYTDDKHDARWIARLMALGILPEGYIAPPEERGLRDLLRRRTFFVQKRTAHLLSIRNAFERSPGNALARSKSLSGPAPSDAALHRRCDQVMSQPQLAPLRAVQTSVPHGRGLEIPTTLWRRDSRSGHELRLERPDPDGCVVRTRSEPHQQENGHGSARRAAGTADPAVTWEDHSSCGRCVYLTGAFLWVRATNFAPDRP